MATDPRLAGSAPVRIQLRAHLLRTLTGHTDAVDHLAWGRLGDRVVLATASRDGTARIWDPASGNALVTLTGHTDAVYHLAWGRLGDRVVLATQACER